MTTKKEREEAEVKAAMAADASEAEVKAAAVEVVAEAQRVMADTDWVTPHSELNVYQSLQRAARMIGAVGKNNQSKGGGSYQYRGIWDLINAVGPVLHEIGILIMPRILSIDHDVMIGRDHPIENYFKDGNSIPSGGKDNRWSMTRIHYRYRIIGPMGDKLPKSLCPEAIGHGADNDDKGSGKADSYSRKMMLSSVFNIITDSVVDNEDFSYTPPPAPVIEYIGDRVKEALMLFADIEDEATRQNARNEWLKSLPLAPHQMRLTELESVKRSASKIIKEHMSAPVDGELVNEPVGPDGQPVETIGDVFDAAEAAKDEAPDETVKESDGEES